MRAPSSGPPIRRGVTQPPPNPRLNRITLLCLTALCASAFADEIKTPATKLTGTSSQVIQGVKTTAYTHTESDHIQYGARTAVGTPLRHGQIRSAAADWSIYPVGTVFQIQGDPSLYVVDDYGSALVGTLTIDLYKPTHTAMNLWGTRRVNIRVLRWGSFSQSLAILQPRAYKAPHVREMVARIQALYQASSVAKAG